MDEQAESGECHPDTAPVNGGSCERALTPGEALAKLFMDNADHGRDAANDELIAALRQRAREIQALADLADRGTAQDDGH
ncbi:MAG: hypothetical protein ACRDS1_08590 [Pseudonocardiaceae bacterium]